MKPFFRLCLLVLFTASLSGCALPGVVLPIENKNIVNDDETLADLNHLVDVYRLTPKLLNELRPSPVIAKQNLSLDQLLSNYQYRVKNGDVLNITIWEHPELTIPAGSYRSAKDSGNAVNSDGTIYYPYIGKVNVANKTISQIRTELTTRLSRFITDPQVDVNVTSFLSQYAYISGEVTASGKQPITNVPLTILDAINNAGGLTENAAWDDVILTRDGKRRTLSLRSLLQQGDLTQNVLLNDKDILYVPRNDELKVFVMGEVNKPATLKMDRAGMTLTEAISTAGDISKLSANAKGIFVIRPSYDTKTKKLPRYIS